MLQLLLSVLLASQISAVQTGQATYYDDGPGLYAAVPSYSWGDPKYDVRVCLLRNSSRCVTVTVRDHCACLVGKPDERLIDLSPAAFRKLEPRIYSSSDPGKIDVTVQRAVPLPATSTIVPARGAGVMVARVRPVAW